MLRLLRRLRLDEDRTFWVLVLATGALAGIMVVLYHIFLDTIYTWLYGNLNFNHPANWRFVVYATLGGVVAALVLRLMPQSRGSGVAQTKIAILARQSLKKLCNSSPVVSRNGFKKNGGGRRSPAAQSRSKDCFIEYSPCVRFRPDPCEGVSV